MPTIASTVEQLSARVSKVLQNPDEAAYQILPNDEVVAFNQAADSIIEAQRSAPLNEGQLQIC